MWPFKDEKPKLLPVHVRIADLEKQEKLANEFACFMIEAVNRGYAASIIVEVDGQQCQSGLFTAKQSEILEYLADCAVGRTWSLREEIKTLRIEAGL